MNPIKKILFKTKEPRAETELKPFPRHIAIIMDGNGRWAKAKAMPRSAGHAMGSKRFRQIAIYANKIGVEILTVYAFSTENWKRPKDEIDAIMDLLRQYLNEPIETLRKENIRIRFIGDMSPLPSDIISMIEKITKNSSGNTGMLLNVALNYGGRDEILKAVTSVSEDISKGRLDPSQLDEKLFSNYMYTAGQPDPDLIIRPSGELRLSNFMLWQAAYSEFWFSSVLWPDFTPKHLDKAIEDYRRRDRRFGGI
jgi:undecaprenyl diphosphate synthase